MRLYQTELPDLKPENAKAIIKTCRDIHQMYILYEVVKHKTDIRGYWLDNKGKLYEDNIYLKGYYSKGELLKDIKDIFKSSQEKAVFYRDSKQGHIINRNGKIDILSHRIIKTFKLLPLKDIRDLIVRYNGLTIFKGQGSYTVEVWRA